ncbi:MAG: YdiU family protein [Actinomycetota bacterium]
MDESQASKIEAEVTAAGLDGLEWDNRFHNSLPVDPSDEIRPRQVHRAMSSRVTPHRPSAPTLVAWSPEVAEDLGLDPDLWTDHAELMAGALSGAVVLPGSQPHAACYGGHQFGSWAGQLGDGRAMSLGEIVDRSGTHHTLQLKGAGPTPYSRGADGFAVLRSSVREFLCSEAMFHLGIPTTRALSLSHTGDKVVRDILYDGNPKPEPGAVVCRVAPSFIRFGNFQIFASRQELEELRLLADFTIDHYFAEIAAAHQPGSNGRYEAFFEEVCRTTRSTVLGWMRVGFVHGVMNTDNMSIHGETIDYGPYGWLEGFDPGWTPNTTDAAHRRYRYGQQPQVAQWNLMQLANALVQLTEDPQPLEGSLLAYGEAFGIEDRAMWRSKTGLDHVDDTAAADALTGELFELLVATETDMTLFFRGLADVAVHELPEDDTAVVAPLAEAYYDEAGLAAVTGRTAAWLRRYAELAASNGRPDEARRAAMNAVNPRYVLRNYLAQLAIDAAEQNDFAAITELLDVVRRPYEFQPDRDHYAGRRPEWARERVGCSQLSCSS